jgi:methionyl-tRNA formyltransferase
MTRKCMQDARIAGRVAGDIMALRLVMMGTGEFALPTFRQVCDSAHEVVGLFTQPDRTGRGHHQHAHPMKAAALQRDIPVFQPQNVNTPEPLQDLRGLHADLAVVAAYGQILSRELLEIPRLGAINLHASLLPKYRGAAPIQYAILEGETETGVCIFQIEPRLDAGPILAVAKTTIDPAETGGELEARLAELAAPLCLETVDKIEAGTAASILQESTKVTKAPRIKKQDGLIDWSQPGRRIERMVRAFQPWPKAYTFLEGAEGRQPLRLILIDVQVESSEPAGAAPPGTVLLAEKDHLVVQSGVDKLRINRLQPAGKTAMCAEEFLRGHSVRVGDRLTHGS